MLDMRRGEVELAGRSLENLASGIDADIDRDLSLCAVASNFLYVGETIRSKVIRLAARSSHFGGQYRYCLDHAVSRNRLAAAGWRCGQGALRREGRRPQPPRHRQDARPVAGGLSFRHVPKYFRISSRKPSRRSARAMP